MAVEEAPRETARSADGTRIGYTRIGSGPIPGVIVHGAISAGRSWTAVETSLAEQCTCYVVVRWGRGGSQARTPCSFEHEAGDIRAVLEVAGPHAIFWATLPERFVPSKPRRRLRLSDSSRASHPYTTRQPPPLRPGDLA